jgi:IS5 family transposase
VKKKKENNKKTTWYPSGYKNSHAEDMRNSDWSLPAYDEVVEENIMCRFEEGRCLPVDSLLFEEFDKIPGKTWKEKLEACAACQCCERHQAQKPGSFVPWIETPLKNSSPRTCECDCRHMARFLCRQAPKRPQVEDPM